jgi:hypothetical protein
VEAKPLMRMVAKLVVKSEGCAEIDAVQNGVKEMVVKMVSTRREGGQQRGKRSPHRDGWCPELPWLRIRTSEPREWCSLVRGGLEVKPPLFQPRPPNAACRTNLL